MKKCIKKLSPKKLILPTPILLLFWEIVLSGLTIVYRRRIFSTGYVLTEVSYEFKKTLRSGLARFKYFLGAPSKDLSHYIDPTLEEQNMVAVQGK